MFTSRAEFRLSLRADNADRRLTQIGKSVGLVDENRFKKFKNKVDAIEKLKNYLQNERSGGLSLWEHLRKPHSPVAETLSDNEYIKAEGFTKDVVEAVVIDAKYEGYLAKQQRLVAGFHTLQKKKVPADLDYRRIEHLRAEAKEKLSAFRPETLARASRIGGITPADITVIQIHLKKHY